MVAVLTGRVLYSVLLLSRLVDDKSPYHSLSSVNVEYTPNREDSETTTRTAKGHRGRFRAGDLERIPVRIHLRPELQSRRQPPQEN